MTQWQIDTNGEEAEYIVTLRSAEDFDQFHADMVTLTNLDGIPNRPCECLNERPFSENQAHYSLTSAEAELVKQDPRVLIIEPHFKHIPDLDIGWSAAQTSLFDGTYVPALNQKNWGLMRSISSANPFSSSYSRILDYTYNLDASGVDVVIVDSGIAENHPEFAVNEDGTGGSRVVDFDWTTLGVSGVVPLAGGTGIKGFLGDLDGHGTNCASIAVGNTCGFAKKAAIYTLRAIPGKSIDIVTGNPLTSLHDVTLIFDLVKAFHLAKPTTSTGYKRPTIMNNSWGFISNYSNMASTTYRGVLRTGTSPNISYGQVASGTTLDAAGNGFNWVAGTKSVQYASVDASILNCMAAGVIVLAAAGNDGHKIDVAGGLDYDNFYTRTTGGNVYYHRGGTPNNTIGTASADGNPYSVICVGNLTTTGGAGSERKAGSSNSGPRVDIYAPGTHIMGGRENANYLGLPPIIDSRASGYYLSKDSGTSQASPQVAGVLALLAQLRPWINQTYAQNWLKANSTKSAMYDNGSAISPVYNDYNSLQAGNNRILYLPYNSSTTLRTNGPFSNIRVSLRIN